MAMQPAQRHFATVNIAVVYAVTLINCLEFVTH